MTKYTRDESEILIGKSMSGYSTDISLTAAEIISQQQAMLDKLAGALEGLGLHHSNDYADPYIAFHTKGKDCSYSAARIWRGQKDASSDTEATYMVIDRARQALAEYNEFIGGK